ncbi:hypothetical protein [Pseudarthrobacter sp. fls2-241-R2A-127]|uniref:hypothetical protein n=1 Tax=Pseudarthrobacter sp. fls2-241-R2A-127 TaxID=3040303 RepID=UPI002556D811|nr:hypothetical protein [Pseudarthrobacter sp. fls2-241-R2A-127]
MASLAQAVLGPGNMLTLWARNRLGNMTYWDFQRSDPQASSEGAALVRATLLRLSDQHQSGYIADGTFLEFLISSGSCLHGHIMEQRTTNPSSETAEQLRRELLLLWRKTFTTIGFDLDAELNQATTTSKLSPLAQAMVPLLHHYAALLTMGKSEADILQGIHLLEDFLIPYVDRPDELHESKQTLGGALRAAIVGYKELTSLLQSAGRHKEAELWSRRNGEATSRLLELEPAHPVLGLEVPALMSEADPGADRLLMHAHFDLIVERLQKEELVRAETPKAATNTAIKPLEHAALFQMLRGHERVDNQGWPELRFSRGTADGESALNASIVLPERNPSAADIILLVVTPTQKFKMVMVWEEVPGDVARLVGRISPFPFSVEDIQSVEVEVHGRKD